MNLPYYLIHWISFYFQFQFQFQFQLHLKNKQSFKIKDKNQKFKAFAQLRHINFYNSIKILNHNYLIKLWNFVSRRSQKLCYFGGATIRKESFQKYT
ncbi:hypothetical protein BpHYR1_014160 [Brachionus plicatilis]|uniref:Uncharacterized protein n=1 Tax=Brachionus plicatilis TaxID=10195 RepID=A0A3M7RD81_BRAPC|nr:hypothetical protein BpHYR1_014160 [Brachionus plicatilis]